MLRALFSIVVMSLVAGGLHTAQAITLFDLEVHGHGSSASGCLYSDQITNLPASSLTDSRVCAFGSATSFASYGVLGAAAGGIDGSGGVADESFYDTLTITGGTGLGDLIMGFGVSGDSILECTNTPLVTCGGTVVVQIVGPGVNKT
jgi:hypothetical protein